MVQQFRRKFAVAEGHQLRDRLADWVSLVRSRIAFLEMPSGIEDRNADVWEALLAVADAAGGVWPSTARVAAVALVMQSKDSTPSIGIRLLSDLRTIFRQHEHLPTDDLLRDLAAIEEAPWGDWKGKPINARQLANFLKQYGVSSKVIRCGSTTLRGYARQDLHDPWTRYLPASDVTSETNVTRGKSNGQGVSDVTDVTSLVEAKAGFKPAEAGGLQG